MDFDFTDDQNSLRDAVARWVEKGFSFERRHGIAKAGGATRAVYKELAELGLTGLAVPAAHGGMGFGAVEAMVVCEELGRGLVNAPYAQAALLAPRLLSAAPSAVQAKWLPQIADGSSLVVLAHQERAARYRLNHVETRAVQSGSAWTLSGAKSVVPAGDEADAWVVPARISGARDAASGIGLFLVEKNVAGAAVNGFPTQDGARAAQLDLQASPATLIAAEGLPLL
ncbi:MAG: acyl-CoA dehydrogenase family protein, partial [Burkholderiaceae bacterium]